jgi:Fic family protein
VTSADRAGVQWPPHEPRIRPWRQASRGGTREDRVLREITVSMPPLIGDREVPVEATLAAALEPVMRAIADLDSTHGTDLAAVGMLLLRTESVASSRIEAIDAGIDDYARALHGIRANTSATSMVAATGALESMIGSIRPGGRIELSQLPAAHRVLMRGDAHESGYAGRIRDVQNWIGGSDHSPRGALYVPPPPETVPAYLDDLVQFVNRDDVPALVQAAVGHAQFESIHTFTDGNGRIGRALINAILRRRGATTRMVIPLASALVAHRDRYFELLGEYRRGAVRPIVEAFAAGARVAAEESSVTAGRLRRMPDQWRDHLGGVRAGSAVRSLLELLPAHPILSSDEACALLGGARSSVFAAIDRLRAAGVLRPLTSRRRDQIWAAGDILDELADLDLRIGAAAR